MGRHPLGRALFDDLTWRGLVHQVTDAELPTLLEHERFTLYIGFDPSADSLHVGHLQQLCLLRRFAEAGHRPIALVGGGTGMIGDPSGQSEERALLAPGDLAANSRAVRAQIAGFLEGSTDDALLVDNQEWLGSVVLVDFLRDVGKLFTVNEMVRKDSVRSRLEDREQGLSFAEFAYQLCQAWDFVQLYQRYGCRLQLGGSDQWGNITEGVALVRRMAQASAYGLTSPLVTKADGTKFGKTGTGTVWLDPARTSPYAFYQFWYRVPDADVGGYLRRFTFLERAEVERLDETTAERPEQRQAQRVLARQVTTMVHGAGETERVEVRGPGAVHPRRDHLGCRHAGRRPGRCPHHRAGRRSPGRRGRAGRRGGAGRPGPFQGAGPAGDHPGRHLRERAAGTRPGPDPAVRRRPARPLRAPAPGAGHPARAGGPAVTGGAFPAGHRGRRRHRRRPGRVGVPGRRQPGGVDHRSRACSAVSAPTPPRWASSSTDRRAWSCSALPTRTVVACAHLEQRAPMAYFGLFAVAPDRQGAGVGGATLAEAERIAGGEWRAAAMEMTVLRPRRDLLAWYERRGYRATGETRPFPYGDERYGVPTRPDLAFVVLVKPLVRP